MDLKQRSGKKLVKRSVTDKNQIESVLGMLDLCALNFDGELGKSAEVAHAALGVFVEALDKYEAGAVTTAKSESKTEKKGAA